MNRRDEVTLRPARRAFDSIIESSAGNIFLSPPESPVHKTLFRLSLGAIICVAFVISLKHVSDTERANCVSQGGATLNEYGRTPTEERMFQEQVAQNDDLIRTTYALQAAMTVRTQEIASTATTVKICVPDTIMEGEDGLPYRVEPMAPCKTPFNFAVVFPVTPIDGVPTISTPTVNGQKLGTTIISG